MFPLLGGEGAINTFEVSFSIVDHFNRVGCEGEGGGGVGMGKIWPVRISTLTLTNVIYSHYSHYRHK